jgi:hypothetical protein
VEKMMLKLLLTLGLLGCCTTASGDILLDQIGSLEGEGVSFEVIGSQYFEPKFTEYDLAVLDNFTVDAPINIHTVELVLNGWNGFEDPSSIQGFQANIYSSPVAASASLIGDVTFNYIDAADANISEDWFGYGYLVSLPVSLDVETGTLWVSVIPENNYTNFGRTGIVFSLLGDETNAYLANPNGGWGSDIPDGLLELDSGVAYRLLNLGAPDPCTLPLPEPCPQDTNQDTEINVNDLLNVLSTWLECGDGTFRPVGDVDGDCCVTVTDIMSIIGSWGSDCNIYGGCCFSDGTCTEITEVDCETNGGEYFGDFTTCDNQECYTVACCISSLECIDLTSSACAGLGGSLHDGSCDSTDCTTVIAGDECAFAIPATFGANPFDTTIMSPSLFPPDPTQCAGTNLNWLDTQKDVWFSILPPLTGSYNFSLCDLNSYDTSIALYETNCINQIACNGDVDFETNCQLYHSELDFELIEDEIYFVRIGGFNEEAGTGTLTISFNQTGACCLEGSCLGELFQYDCEALDAHFYGEGTNCDDTPAPCTVAEADECNEAAVAVTGANYFDTTFATASSPAPDELFCEGTYLEWQDEEGNDSPDIWFIWTATVNGYASFSTCNSESYDTSIVLYKDNCDNQIACNGDGPYDNGCQLYYSKINSYVFENTQYIIRIGGHEGETGQGILHISLIEDTGACCTVDGDIINCQQTNSIDCAFQNGSFTHGVSCSEIECEVPDCFNAILAQNPHSQHADWSAGTSSYDKNAQIDYERAELINLSGISKITFWGIGGMFDELDDVWLPCEQVFDDFVVRAYANNPKTNLPTGPATSIENFSISSLDTGVTYGGQFNLIKYEIVLDEPTDFIEHISIQAQATNLNCWFLWMSSGTGDEMSSFFDGFIWAESDTLQDLSICIE